MPKKNRTEEEKEADREFARKKYAARKAAGLCVICGNEDAYTMVGRSKCADCAEHYRELKNRWRSANPERVRNTNAKARRKKIENGRCTCCGKKLVGSDKANGYLTCFTCRQKDKDRKRQRRREAGAVPREELYQQDHCPYCGGELAPGKRLCQSCIDKFCGQLGLVRDEHGHWRKPKKVEVNDDQDL